MFSYSEDASAAVARGLALRLGQPALLVPRKMRNPTPAFLGMRYSAIPHPTLPVDPQLVAAIRETDPEFIPLWVYYLFRDPPDTYGTLRPIQIYVRHAIARHIPNPRTSKPPYDVEMPPDADFPIPNQIDRILGGCAAKTLPEPYEPLTWDSYWNPWRQGTAKEIEDQFIDLPITAAVKEAEYHRRELEGAKAEMDAYVERKWPDVSTPELKQALERQRLGIPLNMSDDDANEMRKEILKFRAMRRDQLRNQYRRMGSTPRKAGRS